MASGGCGEATWFPTDAPDHLTDEDLFLHPSEQGPLAGDPESAGTPARRMDGTRSFIAAELP